MTLLRKGTETVTVYPEELTESPDGNPHTRATDTGIEARASVQPIGRPDEDSAVGFETTERYRLRLADWTGDPLGPQSRVEWRGVVYSVHGQPRISSGSPRTRHVTYELRRA